MSAWWKFSLSGSSAKNSNAARSSVQTTSGDREGSGDDALAAATTDGIAIPVGEIDAAEQRLEHRRSLRVGAEFCQAAGS
jgi:hypothetical protein